MPYPSKQYKVNPAPYFSVKVFSSVFKSSYSLSDSIFFLDAGLGCEYFTFRIFSNSFCSHGMTLLLFSFPEDGGSFASVVAFVLLLVLVLVLLVLRVVVVVAIDDDFAPAEKNRF